MALLAQVMCGRKPINLSLALKCSCKFTYIRVWAFEFGKPS